MPTEITNSNSTLLLRNICSTYYPKELTLGERLGRIAQHTSLNFIKLREIVKGNRQLSQQEYNRLITTYPKQ